MWAWSPEEREKKERGEDLKEVESEEREAVLH